METTQKYFTTPIYYVNDVPHIGHTYTTTIADVEARYERLKGNETFLLTGTDEHGKKIERAAQAQNKSPQKFADEISVNFKKAWDTFDISYDKFIRTTDMYHKQGVQAAFKTMYEKGDIYKGHYQGEYCVSCETYITENQLLEDNCCPECGQPTEIVNEESYYFKLSSYIQPVLKWIESNPDCILPRTKRKEVINMIKDYEGDLSISRTSFTWGVKLPESLDDPKHIVYVWLDALFNYATALGYGNNEDNKMSYFSQMTNIIGKDILKFHTLFWPAFLMSVELPLPKTVAIHGWWTRNGEKMSKSKGNFINANQMAEAYGVEQFRYFMLREVPFGSDGDFSQQALRDRINSELAGGLGNLVNRMIGLSKKYTDYEVCSDDVYKYYTNEMKEVNALLKTIDQHYRNFTLHKLLETLWKPLSIADKMIQNKIIDSKEVNKRKIMATIAFVANVLAKVSLLLSPVMPRSCEKISQLLGFDINPSSYHKYLVDNTLLDTVRLYRIEPLFPKEDVDKVVDVKVEKPIIKEPLVEYETFMKTDLRIGKVVDAKEVHGSSKLLELKVDIGESTPRTIIAGVKEFYEPSEIIGIIVCVVVNLKPRTIMGKVSQGMILAAKEKKRLSLLSTDTKVEVGTTVS